MNEKERVWVGLVKAQFEQHDKQFKQREWVWLTQEELYEIYDASDDGSSSCGICGACSKCKIEVSIARAIEAKLKEKNT